MIFQHQFVTVINNYHSISQNILTVVYIITSEARFFSRVMPSNILSSTINLHRSWNERRQEWEQRDISWEPSIGCCDHWSNIVIFSSNILIIYRIDHHILNFRCHQFNQSFLILLVADLEIPIIFFPEAKISQIRKFQTSSQNDTCRLVVALCPRLSAILPAYLAEEILCCLSGHVFFDILLGGREPFIDIKWTSNGY